MNAKRLVIVALVILLVSIAVWLSAPVGNITALTYRYGHYWYGHYAYTLAVEDGVPWAIQSFEPTDMPGAPGPSEPWERRRELSERELRAFERLVIRDLRVPSWPEHTGPDPSEITDQDSWSVMFTYEGKKYVKYGYYKFPDGLSKIAGALSVPETGL